MRLLLVLTSLLLASCAVGPSKKTTSPPTTSFFTARDGKQLSLRYWNLRSQPETVIIAVHGIEGAAKDFGNLGKTLSKKTPRTTLYALNLRGGGYDPSAKSKGDISSPNLWENDLIDLNASLRKRHPRANFIWMGESMGSLIVF